MSLKEDICSICFLQAAMHFDFDTPYLRLASVSAAASMTSRITQRYRHTIGVQVTILYPKPPGKSSKRPLLGC